MSTAMMGPRFSPDELRRRLALSYEFSPEQLAVISAPADEPLLVVAGAGSGKTELMALRVMWLVANAYVRPDQVLGLTFTRKAAGELAHRIRLYLSRARSLLGFDTSLTGEPTVATYHSYAARVVREHGLRSGFEPTVRLLTEATCWQLADAAVRQFDSAPMRSFPLGQASATRAVLDLAGELSEHLRDVDEVSRFTQGLCARIEGVCADGVPRPVQEVLDRQVGRQALLPLVAEYGRRKAALEAMDFGDQLRRAATVARDHPEVAVSERDRFRVVLLDEYQDTSQAQVVLLQSLFGAGHPVTAVGDPCQSIYGWRGASAGTLERFPRIFAAGSGEPAAISSLTVSWRNAPQILEVANLVSAALRADGALVKPLRAAVSYTARRPGPAVRAAFAMTYVDEANWIADRIEATWRDWEQAFTATPTTAVLVRARSQIPALETALRERGLPVEVVGLGGLLDNPEVRDVVCTLHVLADPGSGAQLIRLLTGARWRLAPADLVALARRSREMATNRRERSARPGEADARTAAAAGVGGAAGAAAELDLGGDRIDDASLIEALDDLGATERFSAEGYRRLVLLRDELRTLRERLDQSLPDLVADVAQTIGLDVEVAVRAGGAGLARAHLDALGDVAARFAREADAGTLPAFLAFLSAAEEEERGLSPGEVEVVPGAVQILTVHASKGLEWDLVCAAGLCAGSFPAKAKASDHWLKGIGSLPFPLRGDSAGLPKLGIESAVDGRTMRDAMADFDEQWRAHSEREERRLAYVAVTRPRHLLLCSGFRWGDGLSEPREPSSFLIETAQRCRDGIGEVDIWIDPPEPDETNPTMAQETSALWPLDPLGSRRDAVLEGARLVRAAAIRATGNGATGNGATGNGSASGVLAGDDVTGRGAAVEALAGAELELAGRWATEAQLLLAEREREAVAATVEVRLPEHVSVSQLVALRRDPQGLARRLRRPMPEAPEPYSRRGTAFHLWLERRFGGGELFDLDELPGYDEPDLVADEELAALQQSFLESEWAQRSPLRVEVPFATMIAGVVVRGRMDAVFELPGRPGIYEVIDWKTGRQPSGADAQAAAIQLAAYRLAWAELIGVEVAAVSAGFHYVRDGLTVRPSDLLDYAGLTELVAAVPAASARGGA